MGWYSNSYGFRPYVSVAQRRAKAAREVERRRKKGQTISPVTIEGRTIARTFWGEAWCENLESYSDFANRLPRGRTYVRNGSVVDLQIKPGKVTALVSGSSLYTVTITITGLPKVRWQDVKSRCAGQIGSLVELLQGRLSASVMNVVTEHGQGLFPKPAEIKMNCSCPDYAGMCKHVAATLYGVGARLDKKPELLFDLRQVDHLELIEAAGSSVPTTTVARKGKKTIATSELASVFDIELAEPASPVATPTPAKPRRQKVPVARKAVKKKTGQRNTLPERPARKAATRRTITRVLQTT